MSVDDSVARDPKITILAELLGWNRRETVGCLICDVWPICYDQRTHLISPRLINAAAGRADFADALIEAELAHLDKSGKVYVRGAKERIAYLEAKSRAGRQGGLKSAESRASVPKQTSSTTGSIPQARRNPSAPDAASVPDAASALVLVPVSAPVLEKRQRPSASPGGDHQQAIDYFHGAYLTAYGEKPDWKGAPVKTLADLVKAHGLEAVKAKVDRLFAGEHPAWLKPPFTVLTLKAHWNSLVGQSTAHDPLMRIALGIDP